MTMAHIRLQTFLMDSLGQRCNKAGIQYINEPERTDVYLRAFLFGALFDIVLQKDFNIIQVSV